MSHKIRSGSVHDSIIGFWNHIFGDPPVPDLVQYKMHFPQRKLHRFQELMLKYEIKRRLISEFRYRPNSWGGLMKPDCTHYLGLSWMESDTKPRIRRKLQLRRRPVVYFLPTGERYEMFEFVYMLLLCSVFFLSSAPVGATNAGFSHTISDVPNVRPSIRGSVFAWWNYPRVVKTPPTFVVGSSPIKYLVPFPKIPSERDWIVCQAYMQLISNRDKYEAMLSAPKPEPSVKLSLGPNWLSAAIGLVLLAFACSYRWWSPLIRKFV